MAHSVCGNRKLKFSPCPARWVGRQAWAHFLQRDHAALSALGSLHIPGDFMSTFS